MEKCQSSPKICKNFSSEVGTKFWAVLLLLPQPPVKSTETEIQTKAREVEYNCMYTSRNPPLSCAEKLSTMYHKTNALLLIEPANPREINDFFRFAANPENVKKMARNVKQIIVKCTELGMLLRKVDVEVLKFSTTVSKLLTLHLALLNLNDYYYIVGVDTVEPMPGKIEMLKLGSQPGHFSTTYAFNNTNSLAVVTNFASLNLTYRRKETGTISAKQYSTMSDLTEDKYLPDRMKNIMSLISPYADTPETTTELNSLYDGDLTSYKWLA
jgi:hypothetical protein